MASPESRSKPHNLQKIHGDKVMAKKPTTVTELWKRLQQEWTKIKPEQCEKLVLWTQIC